MSRTLLITFFFALLSPLNAEEPLTEWKDVVFIEHSTGDLKLDVVRLKDEKRRPAVLCLHGGFWSKGSRADIQPLAEMLAQRGYVGIFSSYRLTGVAPFPAQLEDVRAAIRYLRENADTYGIDPNQIGVIGSSAGGHLAVLAATDGHCDPEERPNAAVGLGAQSDLTAPHLQNIHAGSGAENWAKYMGGVYHEVPVNFSEASPFTHLSGDDPPIAFVCGEMDHPSTRADRFRRAAFRLGNPTGLTIVPKAQHNLIKNPAHRSAAVDAIDSFFKKHLGHGKTGRIPLKLETIEGADLGMTPISKTWLRPGGGYNGCEGAQWLKGIDISHPPELIFAAHHDFLLFRWSETLGLRLWEEGTAETSTLRPTSGGFYAVNQQSRQLVKRTRAAGSDSVVVEEFEGQRLNRPNDLCLRPGKGTVWFTDPNYLFRSRPLETQELPGQYVFRYDPALEGESALSAPIRNLITPNGITFNANGSRLFVGDSKTKTVWGYDIGADGALKNEAVNVAVFQKGIDGISLAPDGRLWVASIERVEIFTQKGRRLGAIPMPGRCTSMAFIKDGDSHLVAITTTEAAHIARIQFDEAN